MTTDLLDTVSVAGVKAWACGTNNTMIILHGGPGMDHSYLIGPLLPLRQRFRLLFYDQTVRANSGHNLVEQLVEQLLSIVSTLSSVGPISIFAHSWGAYLAYEVLSRRPGLALHDLILASPVGLTKARFDASGQRIIDRLPKEILPKLQALEDSGRDLEMMSLIFPYYLAQDNRTLHCTIERYSNAINQHVIHDLGNYDFRGIGSRFPTNTLIIYGDDDIEQPQDTAESQGAATVAIISNAGHFAFYEQQERFIQSIFSRIPQQ